MKGRKLGRYELVERLGRGGMGEVWLARDPALRRDVAVKVLRREGGDGSETLRDDFVQRFLREARAAASLKHPNIVAIHDVGVDEEPYIVMEHLEGASLRGFVGKKDVPVSLRLSWLVEIAEALSAAHAMGLVHRDIKPDNVMITTDGHAKVLDFGIAKAIGLGDEAPVSSPEAPESFRTQHGRVVGTPKYMAPEQLRGGPIDARVDQWAWACVAYELLTGSMPDRDEPAMPISIDEPEVPFDIAAAIVRARSPDPAKRFESMRALLAAFHAPTPEHISIETMPARRDPDAPTTTGPVRRPWRRVAVVALASFALAATTVYVYARRHGPKVVVTAPAFPSCTFAPLSSTALGPMPVHFFAQTQSFGGALTLGILRQENGVNVEQLVTITADSITTRLPPQPDVLTEHSPSSLFILTTSMDERHYLTYSQHEGGDLVLGRMVSNDALVDITRIIPLEDFRPGAISGVMSSHTKPPSVLHFVIGEELVNGVRSHASIRLYGRNLVGVPIFEAAGNEEPHSVAAIAGAHHLAYTFIAAQKLYVGSFVLVTRTVDVPNPLNIPVRHEGVSIEDEHPPRALGETSSHPASAFDGDTFHVVWPELGTRQLRHVTVRTEGDAGALEEETLGVASDGSSADLLVDSRVFALAWHDGAHVFYGEGDSVRAAAKHPSTFADAAISWGPRIVRTTSGTMVAWISGPGNDVHRAIVTCH